MRNGNDQLHIYVVIVLVKPPKPLGSKEELFLYIFISLED